MLANVWPVPGMVVPAYSCGAEQLGVHPGHAGHQAGVDGVRTEVGGVHGRDAVDPAADGVPLALTGGGGGDEGHDGGRGRQVGRAGRRRGRWWPDHVGFGMAPAAGLPPLGGACHVYQVFSAQVTMPPPPWSRTHSVSRLPTVGPRAGSVAAEPSETHTGESSTRITSEDGRLRVATDDRRSLPALLLAQGPAFAPGAAWPGRGRGGVSRSARHAAGWSRPRGGRPAPSVTASSWSKMMSAGTVLRGPRPTS